MNLTKAQREVLALVGRLGGRVKSEAKAKAAKANGKLGGGKRIYPQCPWYRAHQFHGTDRCWCGYVRKRASPKPSKPVPSKAKPPGSGMTAGL